MVAFVGFAGSPTKKAQIGTDRPKLNPDYIRGLDPASAVLAVRTCRAHKRDFLSEK